MVQNYISTQQALEEYLNEITQLKSRNTVHAYERSVNVFLSYLEQEINLETMPVSDIRISHFYSFIYSLKEKGYSRATFSLYGSGLKSFLRWLLKKGYITAATQDYQSFLEAVNSLIRSFQIIENKIDHEELSPEILINAAKKRNVNILERLRDVAIIYLLLSTDCRPYEVVLLKVCDLDLNNQTGIFQMDNGKTRHILVDPETCSAISKYWINRGWRNPNDPAFARHDKGVGKGHKFLTTRSIQNIIQNIKKSTGLEGVITPDQFRKFYYLKALDYPIDISLSSQSLNLPYFATSMKYHPPKEP